MASDCILLVHGLVERIDDRKQGERMLLREKAAQLGISSFEFDYRGHGKDRAFELSFTLKSAAEDLDTIICHVAASEQCGRIWLVGRGMAAYVILAANEPRRRRCPLVLWQPIFFPRRTMRERGHTHAFETAYAESEGHRYVELEGVRLGGEFFESLEDAKPDLVWAGAEIHILYTQGDKVSPADWMRKYIDDVRAMGPSRCSITLSCLDEKGAPLGHLHECTSERFVEKTIHILRAADRADSGCSGGPSEASAAE